MQKKWWRWKKKKQHTHLFKQSRVFLFFFLYNFYFFVKTKTKRQSKVQRVRAITTTKTSFLRVWVFVVGFSFFVFWGKRKFYCIFCFFGKKKAERVKKRVFLSVCGDKRKTLSCFSLLLFFLFVKFYYCFLDVFVWFVFTLFLIVCCCFRVCMSVCGFHSYAKRKRGSRR